MKRPAIFLDLDDTILDFHWAEKRALSATLQHAGVDPTEELLRRYSDINRSQWELLEEGRLTRDQVLVKRFEILFAERGIEASAPAVRDEYEYRLSLGHRFLPGAEEMLRAMQGSFSLYLASNGSASVQEARIASSGIRPFFEDIFISEELGADKPSAEYFRLCFARIPDFEISRLRRDCFCEGAGCLNILLFCAN